MTLSAPDLPTEAVGHASLFGQLSTGLTLVTGNNRLARVLSGHYSQWRIGRGDSQWPSPDIHSWDAWLGNLWEIASLQGVEGTSRAVPGRQQLVSLWEQVLRNDARAQRLLRPESLATQLRDTRKLLIDWRVDLAHPAWFGDENENYTACHHWNRAFEAHCRKNNWIAPEDRTALLDKAICESTLSVAGDIGLLGFDEFNPAQLALIRSLIASGNTIRNLVISPAIAGADLWESKSGTDELQQMARWARYWIEKEPDSRIGVVVPDLRARRLEIERHLGEILTPGSSVADGDAKPWNISVGIPLERTPMVESAFDLLGLLDSRIDIQDLGRVLRSPWINGGASERGSRALLEKCLRDRYPRQLKLAEVRYRASEIRKYDRSHRQLPPEQQEPCEWNSPLMARLIKLLIDFEQKANSARSPSAWAEAFDRLLSSLNWPRAGTAEIGIAAHEHSENWQTFQAWQDGLRELASLDTTIPRLGRRAAIRQLRQICRERIFQPRTPPANIQVLGLYEVSGLRFDHLWVLGLHNDNWPPAAQSNPFIPGQLQQEAQLPHSSPQRELQVARTITRRLLETADDCVFSFPGQLEGEPVLPSPLLAGDEIRRVDEVPGWQGERWQSVVSRGGEPRIDTLLTPGPLSRVTARGGSSILKNQALCPFRAFASNRLGAEGLETPVDGISPSLHGRLMHKVLEYFWKETRTRQALVQLDQESLDTRIRNYAEQVVNDERSLNDRETLRGVEANRLARLAATHLELEKNREPFEVVAFEKEILQEIEGQTIRLVIDRIDRLPSGQEVIIDYKTGKVDPKKWFGERPEDPQLPLYAISAEGPPAAVAFAVIRDEECLYRGVVTQQGLFPGLPPKPTKYTEKLIEAGENMPATISSWRQTLQRLMIGFLAGEAAVDPRDGSKTCTNSYCELQSLCRIGELEQFRKLKNGETST
jgi:probable DNA repair protein